MPYTKKAGYVGISDLTVIGVPATVPGYVMCSSNVTAVYDKIHEVITCSGPCIIIDDVEGEASADDEACLCRSESLL